MEISSLQHRNIPASPCSTKLQILGQRIQTPTFEESELTRSVELWRAIVLEHRSTVALMGWYQTLGTTCNGDLFVASHFGGSQLQVISPSRTRRASCWALHCRGSTSNPQISRFLSLVHSSANRHNQDEFHEIPYQNISDRQLLLSLFLLFFFHLSLCL